jgi:hypothetical protein
MTLRCLGTENGQPDFLQLLKGLSINAAGRFSYHGTVTIPWTYSAAHPRYDKAKIALSGRFRSSKKANITLSIHFGRCKTMHMTLNRQGPVAGSRPRTAT